MSQAGRRMTSSHESQANTGKAHGKRGVNKQAYALEVGRAQKHAQQLAGALQAASMPLPLPGGASMYQDQDSSRGSLKQASGLYTHPEGTASVPLPGVSVGGGGLYRSTPESMARQLELSGAGGKGGGKKRSTQESAAEQLELSGVSTDTASWYVLRNQRKEEELWAVEEKGFTGVHMQQPSVSTHGRSALRGVDVPMLGGLLKHDGACDALGEGMQREGSTNHLPSMRSGCLSARPQKVRPLGNTELVQACDHAKQACPPGSQMCIATQAHAYLAGDSGRL
eukprot:1151595-Pelagomonas_calceolata.AAC.2